MTIKKVNHVYTKVIQRLLKNFPKNLNQQVKGIQILKLQSGKQKKCGGDWVQVGGDSWGEGGTDL